MRVLGVDYGAVRVGIAIGDTETCIATPWSVLARENDEKLIRDIQNLAAREAAERVVVGIPRPLFDQMSESDQTRSVKKFVARLRDSGLLVEEENETWSSVLATKQALETGAKGRCDDLAAAHILQGWLDRYAILA